MCGITGKVNLNNKSIIEKDILTMNTAILHRGPDDGGVYVSSDKKVGLGNRRLAIVDLSEKGHQPMSYKNKYWITFNGEIYNFLILREKLEKEGVKFHSKTDTEVILALYDKYGANCLKYLRGMFAFAIYDLNNHTLFLARDRMGKKPLKYYWDGENFIFSSELKGILTQKEVKRIPDLLAIHHYLSFSYVPAPWTGFEKIYKLSPGHHLTLDLKSKSLKIVKYWEIDFSEKWNLSENQWSEKILETLEESTKLRMIADVPIGAFLSGGVDSSAVVAMMTRFSNKPIKTFNIGFKEEKYDETKYAKQVSKLFGTDHETFYMEPQSLDDLPEMVFQYEEPYSNSSAIASHFVSKMARKQVTVALNGDGGDENFAGYDRYKRISRDVDLDAYLKFIRPGGIPISKLLFEVTGKSQFNKANQFLNKSRLNLASRFATYNNVFLFDEKNRLYSDYFKNAINEINSYSLIEKVFSQNNFKDLKDFSLKWDLTSYLPEELLVKVDIASMKNSLEARSPFVDHNMVELAAKIPFSLKYKNGVQKYILKKSLEKILPHDILYRPKMGFSIPLKEWVKGSLYTYAKSLILSEKAISRNLFNSQEIKNLLEKHKNGDDSAPKIWNLMTLELWFREFID